VLVFGGDGTLLRAARDFREQGLPFLGINKGTMGYLTEVDGDHMEEALARLVEDDVTVKQRMMLQGQIKRGGRSLYEDGALNEIAIGSRGLTVLDFKVYVDGKYLATYRADGMVVATPTGSTGYSLSAGGPVVNPEAALLVLTPVSPHSLISRSIVLGPESSVELEILEHPSRQDAQGCISFDGDEIMELQPGDRIFICRSQQTTGIITCSKESFLETLRMKMGDR
jgi:NAD+ kinase